MAWAKTMLSTFPPVATTITLSPFISFLRNKADANAAAPPGSSTSFNLRNAKYMASRHSSSETECLLRKAYS